MAMGYTQNSGNSAEDRALLLLKQHGMSTIARNYRCNRGEIDLIMRHRNELIFVEVKLRRNPRYGGSLHAITPQKIQRILHTAKLFLVRHPHLQHMACRFDVIAITGSNIEWIRHAFSADGGDCFL